MTISVDWDNQEKTIVTWDFDGRWSWSEYYHALEQSDRLLESVNYKVDLLINFQKNSLIPNGFPAQFRRMARFRPKAGVAIVVTNSYFIETMMKLLIRIQPQVANRAMISASLENARETLRNRHQRA